MAEPDLQAVFPEVGHHHGRGSRVACVRSADH